MKVTFNSGLWLTLTTVLKGITSDCRATVPPSSRRALLFDTLQQAQIDPESLTTDTALSTALHEHILNQEDAPIDILSVVRLQCRVAHEASNPHRTAAESQAECTAEMFDLTQQAKIAPPNVTLAFGSDPYAKNRDFMEWCLRLLTSSYFDNENHLETFRTDMLLSNPYWKAAVKATYLSCMRREGDVQQQYFEDIVQDPKLWANAIHALKGQELFLGDG